MLLKGFCSRGNLAAHHQSLSLFTKEKIMQVAMQNSKPRKSRINIILSLICLTTNAFALELNDETKQVIANEFLKCAYSTENISQKKSALCGCVMDGCYRKYSLKQLQTNMQAILQEEQKTCMDLLK
jgi:hypothetical protein